MSPIAAALWCSDADAALSPANVKKSCLALKTCYKGGVQANSCKVQAQDCPPCVTFDNDGCFELINGACKFGYLCSEYWAADTGTDSGSGSGKPGTTTAGNGGAGAGAKNSTANPSPSTSARSSSGSGGGGGAGTAGSAAQDDGNDLSAIFAIIGATMGIIAVAVIFLTLVRRSRAAHNDEDEEAATPAPMTKDPQSATAAVTYAAYSGTGAGARSRNTSADTAEVATVASYYSQKPQNLPMASPRVAGRAVPAPAPRSAQPVPNPPATARAMPVFANKAPLGGAAPQTQQQTQVADPVQLYYQVPAEPVVVALEAAVPAAVRRASSPRNRRESFEF